MATVPAKFKVGDHVKHAADPSGAYPVGTGVVETVNPDTGEGCTYNVRCDKTGKILPGFCKEAALAPDLPK